MQLTETDYNAIVRTLNLFGLNPSYARSLSPEDCKEMLQAISHQYVEKEKLDERVICLDFQEHLVWSRIFYADGSNLVFPNKEEVERYQQHLDDVIATFADIKEPNSEDETLLKVIKGIRERLGKKPDNFELLLKGIQEETV